MDLLVGQALAGAQWDALPRPADGMGTTPAPSPDNKRAKGLRSPRQKKRPLTPDAERIANLALSRLADAASTEQVRMSQLSDIEPVDDLSSQHLSAAQHAARAPQRQRRRRACTTPGEYSMSQGGGSMSQDLMQPPDLPSQPDLPTPESPRPRPRSSSQPRPAAQQSPLLAMGMPLRGAGNARRERRAAAAAAAAARAAARGGSKATRRGPHGRDAAAGAHPGEDHPAQRHASWRPRRRAAAATASARSASSTSWTAPWARRPARPGACPRAGAPTCQVRMHACAPLSMPPSPASPACCLHIKKRCPACLYDDCFGPH